VIRYALGVIGAAVLVFYLGNCDAPPPEGVKFAVYDGKVLADAREAGKPIVVYVTIKGDPECREQERGALIDPKVILALAPFTRLKDDVTGKHPSELALTGVGRLPIFTFYDAAGEPIERLIGTQTSDKLIATAQKAARK
jgi:thiol:disulfide interchange protein